MKINCQNIRKVAQDYLSDELSGKERKNFIDHLDECSECFSHMEYQEILKKAVQKKMLGVKCSQDLKSKIMKNLVVVFLFASIAALWCRPGTCEKNLSDATNFPNPTLYNEILKEHVEEGFVSYHTLERAPSRLDAYLDLLAEVNEESFNSWTEPEQITYLINLYNAWTLRLILDHYPIESIRKIGNIFSGPWDQKIVSLFGEKTTLNKIEHDILRENYDEPRVHFALVCAAKGCPPLRAEPYDPERLEEQLEEQGRIFMGDEEKNYIDFEKNIFYLSPIFKWFKKDFLKNSDSLIDYVAPYFPEETSSKIQDQKYKVKFTYYDWSLNAR